MDHYQQPQQVQPGGYPPQQGHYPQVAPVVTLKEWMLTLLIMLIPIVNIIMMFVYAFGDGNPSKKNYFKANLIYMAIFLVPYIILMVVLIGVLSSSDLYY